jgi:serine/threonine protein phosphatase PrpC
MLVREKILADVDTDVTEVSAPSVPVEVRVGGRTDIGKLREHNEDCFVVLPLDSDGHPPEPARHALGDRGTLLVVCDGMGGANAGDVASRLAVDSLLSSLLDDQTTDSTADPSDDAETERGRKLRSAAWAANALLLRRAQEDSTCIGMGTTMTAVHLWNSSALVAQVGDSRAYVWRRNRFTQITRDQSLINALLDAGMALDEARAARYKNVISQALGAKEEVDVQLVKVELRRGDRLLVCSDGVSGLVSDEQIAKIVSTVDDPDQACKLLIDAGNRAGGKDNLTAIVAHVGGLGLCEPRPDELIEFAHWLIDPPTALSDAEARDVKSVSPSRRGPALPARSAQGKRLPADYTTLGAQKLELPDLPAPRRLLRHFAALCGLILVMFGSAVLAHWARSEIESARRFFVNPAATAPATPPAAGAP